MTYPTTTAIILAAGKGTRMNSDLAKVLHAVAGRPMVVHVVETCLHIGIGAIVAVVGWQREAVTATVAPLGAISVVQDRQLGTGHAVLCAESSVHTDTVLVLCGDTPLVSDVLLRELLDRHQRTRAACTVVAARLADPARYGRMITGADGRLARIVEYKDANDHERAVNLINSGIYAFAAADLFRCLKLITPANAQGEYYLTDVIALLVAESKPVELVVTDDAASVLGVNTPQDLAEVERLCVSRAHRDTSKPS